MIVYNILARPMASSRFFLIFRSVPQDDRSKHLYGRRTFVGLASPFQTVVIKGYSIRRPESMHGQSGVDPTF